MYRSEEQQGVGDSISEQIVRNVKQLLSSKEICVEGRRARLSIRQREREMRVGKLKWMRQALKRIGHGDAVGQGRFVSRLRSQNGSNTAGFLSAQTNIQRCLSVLSV